MQASEAPPQDGDVGERDAAIASRLAEVMDGSPVGAVRRLSGGASRETYICDSERLGQLILQCERTRKPTGEPPGQAALLQAAAAAGVPVAAVVANGQDDPVLGTAWTLVRALPGTSDPTRILAEVGQDGAGELLDDLAAALAAVHRMPADAGLAPVTDEPLAQLRELHDRLGEPHPTFELAFRTLGADRPARERTLVHGDFRMGNLMVDGRSVTGVLDWELTHVGDPVEDLGWLCVPAWRFSRPDLPAAGLGTREELLASYARHSGVSVPVEDLRRWELAGTLRWGVICVMQAFAHLSGATRSVEHAVIGRRACEVEWDLLELLDDAADDGRAPDMEPDPGREAPALHDRPTAAELIDAARGALGDHVLPQLEGRPAFELRVSLRALGIVRRELEQSASDASLRASVLASLGVADERELAGQIRAGNLDDRREELIAALRRLTRAKLEVANPRYLALHQQQTEAP